MPPSVEPEVANCTACATFSPSTSRGRSVAHAPTAVNASCAARPYGACSGLAMAKRRTRPSRAAAATSGERAVEPRAASRAARPAPAGRCRRGRPRRRACPRAPARGRSSRRRTGRARTAHPRRSAGGSCPTSRRRCAPVAPPSRRNDAASSSSAKRRSEAAATSGPAPSPPTFCAWAAPASGPSTSSQTTVRRSALPGRPSNRRTSAAVKRSPGTVYAAAAVCRTAVRRALSANTQRHMITT